jgi:hypothetical protein
VDSGRKPGDAFDHSSASGVVDPDGEASVRVKCGSDVPAFRGVDGPGAANILGFVSKDASAGRGKRGAVVVKETVDLGVG